MKKPVDKAMLREIRQEALELRASGEWTLPAYNRLFKQALEAAHGKPEYVEFLDLMADPAWRVDAVTWEGATTMMPGMNIPQPHRAVRHGKVKRVHA